MTIFSTVFQKNRRMVGLITAFLFFLLILISPNKVRPLVGNFSNYIFFSFFSEIRNYRYDISTLMIENSRLKALATEYSLQLNAVSEARRENTRLREFLGFEPPDNFSLVPVKIVSLLEQINPNSAVINKGLDDSLEINMPVVNRFGLVGKVSEVTDQYAVVSLLTDPANAVSGRIAESRQIGIVRYSFQRGMFLDNLPADAKVKTGDLIISSGLGGIYPAGLTVAVVDTAFAQKGDILKTAYLKSTVNFKEIDELYVLVKNKL